VNGAASPADLETALQVMWLEFTAPNDDKAAFEVFRRRLGEMVRQRRNDPSAVYSDMVQEVNTGGHPLYQPLEASDIEKLDLAWARGYYRDRFANAADFTFFIVGSFDPQTIVPLVERYVASLPAKGTRSTRFDASALKFPAQVVERTVALGREPLSLSTLTFAAPAGRDLKDRYQARAAAAVLRTLLRGMLREEKGQAYSASVGWSSEDPADYGTVTVSFGSSPENAPGMARSVLAEIEKLQQQGPPPEAVANEQEIQRREHEVALRQNGWWLGMLQSAHVIGADPRQAVDVRPRIDALTPESLREAFRRYAPRDRYTNIRLDPAPGTKAP
jgi:zinc protease